MAVWLRMKRGRGGESTRAACPAHLAPGFLNPPSLPSSLAGLWAGEAGNGYLPGVISGVLLGGALAAAGLYLGSLKRKPAVVSAAAVGAGAVALGASRVAAHAGHAH